MSSYIYKSYSKILFSCEKNKKEHRVPWNVFDVVILIEFAWFISLLSVFTLRNWKHMDTFTVCKHSISLFLISTNATSNGVRPSNPISKSQKEIQYSLLRLLENTEK